MLTGDGWLDCIHIFTDASGESHFGDIRVKLTESQLAPPAAAFLASTPWPARSFLFATFPAGWVGEWHPTPWPQVYFQLSGRLEVEVSGGEVRQTSAGAVYVVEDLLGKGHVTRVVGDEPVIGALVRFEGRLESELA